MANKRIKDISTTATSPNADDVCVIDGATAGTRKIAAGPLGGNFDENIVVENGGNKTTYASNFLRSENGSYYIDAYNVGGDILFRTSVASALDTTSMIIDGATGRVAIGLSSPDAKLHVANSAASGGTFKFVDGSSRTLQDLSGGALSWSAASVIGGTSWAGTADHEIKTLTTARDTLLVTGPASGTEYGLHVTGLQSLFDGKLGIGVSPSENLSVSSANTGRTGVSIDNTSTGGRNFILGSVGSATDGGAAAGSFTIRDGDASANRLVIDSGGNCILQKGGGAYLQFKDASAVRGSINVGTSDGLIFTTGASFDERMRVEGSTGNVGIGVSTVPHKLFVQPTDGVNFSVSNNGSALRLNAVNNIATANVAAEFTASSYSFIGGNVTVPGGQIQVAGGAVAAPSYAFDGDGDSGISRPTSDTVNIVTGGTERLRIDSSGRVGQAGITPGSYHANADNLVLANDGLSGESGLTIRSGTSDGGSIYFSDGTTGDQRYRGYISYSHSSDALQFGSAGAESMRLDSQGRLGVGTSAPTQQLEVSGAAPTVRVTDTSDGVGNGASIGKLEFYGNDGSSGGVGVRAKIDTVSETAAGNQYGIALSTSTGNAAPVEQLRLSGAGQLGVGVSPDKALTVKAGTINTDIARLTGANDDRGLVISTAANGVQNDATIEYDAVSGASAGQHVFKTDGTARWKINSSGNLAATGAYGIDFGQATVSAGGGTGTTGSASNSVLSDYELGSWNPSFATSGADFTTMTMDVIAAQYCKVGRYVHCQAYIRTDNVDATGASGTVVVQGLPFLSDATTGNYATLNVGYSAAWQNAPAAGYVQPNAAYVRLTRYSTTGASMISPSDLTAGGSSDQNELIFSISYIAST